MSGPAMLTLEMIVRDFAAAVHMVDASRPVQEPYREGIGPLTEVRAVSLCTAELARSHPDRYANHQTGVKYDAGKCDLCIGRPPRWDWAIEAKLLRFLGDNGKQNGNMLMHILSPYPGDRSALTDCSKLAGSAVANRKAILIFGYPHDDWPLEPAVDAFEKLAADRVTLGPRVVADAGSLIHPVHSSARVIAWQVTPLGHEA